MECRLRSRREARFARAFDATRSPASATASFVDRICATVLWTSFRRISFLNFTSTTPIESASGCPELSPFGAPNGDVARHCLRAVGYLHVVRSAKIYDIDRPASL